MALYKIVRRFRNSSRRHTVKSELNLEEAQAHCNDPETSGLTCSSPHRIAYTRRVGHWFDSYEEMK